MKLQCIAYCYFVLLILSGCISEKELTPHFPHFILHGHGAKPWIVQSILKDGEEKASSITSRKTAFVFYDDFSMFKSPISLLGSNKGQKGNYLGSISLKTNDTLLKIEFNEGLSYLFSVQQINNHQLQLLRISENNESEEIWYLTTLPKPTNNM
ncbi:MAG: hypothetical protein JJT77_04420 [Crocinitomicaceae bacterium]|nr:hypothetical protein [Crocinitomicaceae bacterium]